MKTVHLRDVADFINGYAFKPSDWDGQGKQIIRIQNLTDSSKPYNSTSLNVDDKYIVRQGDLLVSWSATLGVFEWKNEDALLNQHIFKVVVNDRVVDKGYLKRVLNNSIADMEKHLHGATMRHINRFEFLETKIPLPPLEEQKRIAAILDKADAIRRKRAEALRLTDQFLQSVFLDMFGDPVTNPKGWPTIALGELAPDKGLIVDGPFGSSLKPECYVPEGVRVIRNFNIHDDFFDDSAFKYVTQDKFEEIRRSEVTASDILLSTKGTIGDVCLMPEFEGPSVLSASGTVRIRIPEDAPATPQFVASQMAHPSYKSNIHSFQAGSNQKYLNLSGIREMRLIIPPVLLQDVYLRIRNKKRESFYQVKNAECLTIDLFNALTSRAFRGNL